MVIIKRIYLPPAPADGYRVLVDGLWPRGVAREAAKLDEWLKEIAPSPALRTWFGHRHDRWREFQQRYRAELESPAAAPDLARLAALARKRTLTLVYGARSAEHNHALVLRDVLTHTG